MLTLVVHAAPAAYDGRFHAHTMRYGGALFLRLHAAVLIYDTAGMFTTAEAGARRDSQQARRWAGARPAGVHAVLRCAQRAPGRMRGRREEAAAAANRRAYDKSLKDEKKL